MSHHEATSLEFHCGVCAKQLTDATALFTSCGHFFCYTPGAKCTRLQPSQGSGRCEQCGKQCDSGDLANQGSRYDTRVRSFVFSDLTKDLRNIAEIVEFRNIHLKILGENAAEQQKRIISLTAECKLNREENEELRRENKMLRMELAREKNRKQPITDLGSAAPTRAYDHQHSDKVAVIELDPPTRTKVLQSSKRKDPAQVSRRIGREAEPSFAPRRQTEPSFATRRQAEPSFATRRQTGTTYEPTHVPKSINKRREPHALASRVRESLGGLQKDHRSMLKRRWVDRSEADCAYGSSKAVRTETASRFGYPNGDSKGRTFSYKERQSFGGDWQRKVSSVPRPSATPDKLRRRSRRSMMDPNPLGKRY